MSSSMDVVVAQMTVMLPSSCARDEARRRHLEAAVAGDDVDVVVEDGLTEGPGSSRPWTRRAFMAKPTAAMPVPSGPVVANALGVAVPGWPVREPVCSVLMSSSSTGSPRGELDVLGQRTRVGPRMKQSRPIQRGRPGRDVHDLVVEEVGGGSERDGGTGVARSVKPDGVGGEDLSGLTASSM